MTPPKRGTERTHTRTPSYRRHRLTGRPDLAFVELDGKRIYLGQWGTPESKQEYDRRIAEWLASGRRLPVAEAEAPRLTVVELAARYWEHAQQHFRCPDGSPSKGLGNVADAIRVLVQLYGNTPAADFGPKSLRAVRESMIAGDPEAPPMGDGRKGRKPWNRNTVNDRIQVVKSIFGWGVEHELIPGSVHHALRAVKGLRKGRTAAKEPEPVGPVPYPAIEAIRPHVSRQVWAIIQLQLRCGARPGELVGLCAKDIDTSDQPWTVRLTEHKTAHHGKDREFWFNDEAQAILSPFMLGRPISAPLFSPAEAEAERRAAMRERRTSHPSANKSRDAKRRKRPANTLGDAYTVDSYRRAIQRGCAKAFPYPPKLRGKRGEKLTPEQKAERGAARQEWRRTHYWHPHQLRHNFLTELRRAAGIDVAQTAAGHSTLDTTAIYAERDRARARAAVAALKIG